MATIHGIYSVRLQDFLGVKGSYRHYFRIDDTKTIAQLVVAVQDMNLILNPTTDAKGLSVQVTLLMPTTNLKTAVTVDNRLENGALFTFDQAGIHRAESIVIPAFAEGLITNGKVDLTATAVTDFTGEITASGSAAPKESAVQNLLPTFLSCRLNDRKYRKSDTRVTSETA